MNDESSGFDSRPKRSHSSSRAFTLLELLISIAILGILVTVGILSYGPLIGRAQAYRCMGNMKSLHVSFAAYVKDNAQWPQAPEDLYEAQDDGPLEDWWIEALTPYGGEPRVWECPTIKRIVDQTSKNGRPKMHYQPTPFDAKPFTPFRWANQPWLVEIGNMHGRGAHIIFPDGSIRVMDDIVKFED
ncbi:MAG: type II secretion system protein [Terrimicrobiaceae bacterium]